MVQEIKTNTHETNEKVDISVEYKMNQKEILQMKKYLK